MAGPSIMVEAIGGQDLKGNTNRSMEVVKNEFGCDRPWIAFQFVS